MKLQGKIAIVTGAGKGIGREAALAVASEGATVVAVARTQADLDETVRLIEEAGGSAIALSRDLTDAAQVQSMVDEVVARFGRIDILVNNAGGYPSEIYDKVRQQAIKIWEWSEEQWDQIIFYFRQLPLIDPNREFVNEARSLRQSILETIMDSEASNQQIYDLYHLSDDSNLEYYGRNEDLELLPDTDYFGRDVHTHSDVNDGFDRFGYNHRLFTDPAATQFTVGEPAKRGIESLSAAEFYPGIPNSLREDYMDLNWFEVPVMKEWMKEIPTGGASVDWESMRDKNGNLKIAQDQVLTKEGKLKVTLENVQKLHDLLEEEYEGVGDLASEPEHADDAKSQSMLIREYKTNPVERNRWHQLEEDIEYPVDKQDFAFMSLLNESLKQFKEGEEEEEEEGHQNEEEGETK